MAFRGAREANDALRRQNELLEAETRRIAHEIHDCAGQLLVSVYMQLHQLSATAPAEVTSVLAHVSSLIDQVQGHLRRFAHELRPTILDDLGLVPALHALGQGVTSRAGITVSVEGSTDGRLPAPIEIALYRAVQEALTNTMKHARAARAEVRVARQVGEVRCTVTDDGIGFPTQESAGGNRGLGLAGLRERLAPLGGRVNWGSVPRGGGAFVTVVIPLEAPYVATRSGC
jgi:signal transduction histidine kinase